MSDEADRCCDCGRPNDGTDGGASRDEGTFDEGGVRKWICYGCWCREEYGRSSPAVLKPRGVPLPGLPQPRGGE